MRGPPERHALLWARLPPSHKRAYVEYVTEAKKPETRARRIEMTVAKLAERAPLQ